MGGITLVDNRARSISSPRRPAGSSSFAALAAVYHDMGLNVIPIIPGTKQPPRGAVWKQWQAIRQTEADVEELIRRYPRADIAIINGTPFAPLVDIETDGPEGVKAIKDRGLPLPQTARWNRPRGRGDHRYYRTAHPVRKCKPHPQIDVLGNATYSVVPTSGGRQWIDPLESLVSAARLPREWETFLHPPAQVISPPAPGTAMAIAIPTPREVQTVLADLNGARQKVGELLRELFRHESVAYRVAVCLGICPDIKIGESFCCVAPKHEEWNPSASLYRDPRSGMIVYHDWHRKGAIGHTDPDARDFYLLPEVYAAQRTGVLKKYRRGAANGGAPALVVFTVDALAAAALITPVPGPLIPLPPNVPAFVHIVYQGINHLFGLRWLISPGAPAPLTWGFLACWCDLPITVVKVAMRCYLLRLGIVEPAGTCPNRFGGQTTIFLPGKAIRERSNATDEEPVDGLS